MEIKIAEDNKSLKKRRYDISGELTIQTIKPLYEELKNCIGDYDCLTINLIKITGFDTSAFQMLYSLKNTFLRDKKVLTVNCDFSAEIVKLLENCGIGRPDNLFRS